MNPFDIYRTIEEIVGEFGENQIKLLLGPKEFTTDEIHGIRGKAQAAKTLIQNLRNALGYDPQNL